MNLSTYISESKPLISIRLQQFLTEKRSVFSHDLFALDLLQRIEKFSLRGKMLRGMLVVLGYELAGGTKRDEVLDLAVAMELTQAGALIHDDILDQDEIRRGEPTIHFQYASQAQSEEISNSLFYGQGIGICAGDICLFLAFESLAKGLKGDTSHTTDSFSWYTYTFQRCIFAQMLDFRLGQSTQDATQEEILSLYLSKTAYYSIVLPLLLGAHKVGASPQLCQALEEIGKSIGVIFQIKDDELGFLGKTDEIGKPEGSDIRENKKTLIRQLLFAAASEKDLQILKNSFGNPDVTHEQIEEVRSLYLKYKINTQINVITEPFITNATKKLETLPLGKPTDILTEFLTYNLHRVT